MSKRFILIVLISISPIIMRAQALRQLLDQAVLSEYLNPATTTPDQINQYSLVLSHRDQLTSSRHNAGSQQFVGGKIRLFPNSISPYDALLSGSFSQIKTSPANFQNIQLGAAFIFAPDKLRLSMGAHAGYGRWSFDPGTLRPWDEGDDLLLTNQNSSGQWHFGVGLSASYQLREGNRNATIFLDASLPYLPLCGENCFDFKNDDGSSFAIRRSRSWNINAKYLKLGLSGNTSDLNIRSSLYYFEQLISENYGFILRGRINKHSYQPMMGFAYDFPSQSLTMNIGLLAVTESNLNIGFNFSLLLFGNNQFSSPTDLLVLRLAKDVIPDNRY